MLTATLGSIGRSGTWGARFSEDVLPEVTVLHYLAPIGTPFGASCRCADGALPGMAAFAVDGA